MFPLCSERFNEMHLKFRFVFFLLVINSKSMGGDVKNSAMVIFYFSYAYWFICYTMKFLYYS